MVCVAMPGRPDDYEVLLTIGAGSYGKCRKVRRKADGKVGSGSGGGGGGGGCGTVTVPLLSV